MIYDGCSRTSTAPHCGMVVISGANTTFMPYINNGSLPQIPKHRGWRRSLTDNRQRFSKEEPTKMRLNWRLTALLLSLALTIAACAQAEVKTAPALPQDVTGVVGVFNALKLAKYGAAKKSPKMLIAAAEILTRNSFTRLSAGRPSTKAGAAIATPDILTPSSLLSEAKKMSANDPEICAMADRVTTDITMEETSAPYESPEGAAAPDAAAAPQCGGSEGPAAPDAAAAPQYGGSDRAEAKVSGRSGYESGRSNEEVKKLQDISGVKYVDGRVGPHVAKTYKVEFKRGVVAHAAVSGSGKSKLDLLVFDSKGKRVAFDSGKSDDCLVQWLPNRTETFTIKVRNKGEATNAYILITS